MGLVPALLSRRARPRHTPDRPLQGRPRTPGVLPIPAQARITKRQLLIDADTFIYRAAAAAETTVEWEPFFFTTDGNLDDAISIFNSSVGDLKQQVEDELNDDSQVVAVICLSDAEENFRKDIADTYKSNRGKRPLLYKALRDYVMEEYHPWSSETTETVYCIRPRLEADDILGILGTSPKNRGNCVIYSEDKDLLQIPGLHIKDGMLTEITEEDGDLFFYRQILTGDTVDGYPGCPGIGPVKADRLLDASEDYWKTIVGAYEKNGLTEADAIVQARLARILRYTDYDFKNRLPILWTPSVAT